MSEIIAVAGGGSIGVSFALLFARAGAEVRVFEPNAARRASVLEELSAKAKPLAEAGLLEESPGTLTARVLVTGDLMKATANADLVQECVPERAEIKTAFFRDLSTAPILKDTVVASSSSALTASVTAHGTGLEEQILVAHPGNPPHLIPVIEVVPSPNTRTEITDRALAIYREAGLSPVLVRQEVEGFLFNRLQGAVLREAYALVRDGVATVEDIDTVMRDGLGRRWAFMGPFETVDLNTRGGITAHAERMGSAYERMGAERGQHDPWTTDLVANVNQQRRKVLPLDQWEERVAWRDQLLLTNLITRTRKETP
ncbi:MAG: 3-hydroxyacyl-CoA dehydrogenase [Galactobacter sp.]|uniref:3-hydroxyacyl-CoA dehydrogenase n=1 Tax=Galactobacter sp. TaxID=2676125 RepID=UPI0025C6BD0D|nr:3-hydroxyacyl-CoA dehydrogenase [Galactobacter sp.]